MNCKTISSYTSNNYLNEVKMDLKIRRRFTNRKQGSYMLSIPPLFLDNMGALESDEVLMWVADRNHIVLEVVRREENDF
jgi:antitoxin component of MazEF toxin-antitoxin module